MLDFYLVPQIIRIGISGLGTTVVVIQSFYLAYIIFGMNFNSKNRMKTIFEALILLYLLLLTAAPSIISVNIKQGAITQNMLESPRLIVFTMLLVTSVILFTKNKSLLAIALITSSTLPHMENIHPYMYIIMYFITLVFHLLRSISNLRFIKSILNSNISNFSIKETIDSLSSGLVFYEKDGSILLVNNKMIELMIKIFGKPIQNIHKLKEYIQKASLDSTIQSNIADNSKDSILQLHNNEIWLFSKNSINNGNNTYYQLTASNISHQWQLINELKSQEDFLLKRSDNLRQFIDNLFQIRRYQALLKIRNKMHDILGQQISVFVRRIEQGEHMLPEDINAWVDAIVNQLYSDVPNDAKVQLIELKDLFNNICVEIKQNGELPDDCFIAEAFISIIREATTNAVRHGLATIVNIHMVETTEAFILTVTDNGNSCSNSITPGGGINSMLCNIENVGGYLNIEAKPQFSITANIPKVHTSTKEADHDTNRYC